MAPSYNNYSGLLSQHDRDIQKPLEKDSKYRKSAYIEYFVHQSKTDLKIQSTDSMEERSRKNAIVQTFVSQLNAYTRTAVIQLKSRLDQLNTSAGNYAWKRIPGYLKDECVQTLELLAKGSNLGLDRFVDSWGAKKLIASNYHNYARKFKVFSFTL